MYVSTITSENINWATEIENYLFRQWLFFYWIYCKKYLLDFLNEYLLIVVCNIFIKWFFLLNTTSFIFNHPAQFSHHSKFN